MVKPILKASTYCSPGTSLIRCKDHGKGFFFFPLWALDYFSYRVIKLSWIISKDTTVLKFYDCQIELQSKGGNEIEV